MAERTKRILWVDDEIDSLKPHVLFLQSRGYEVLTATNGNDAIALVEDTVVDLVLLDEMMTGLDGLATLSEIKSRRPTLPIVMVTKNEEEDLMEEAIGKSIDDYLTKPVNPSQILLAAKKLLDARSIRDSRLARDYVAEVAGMARRLDGPMHWRDWMEAARLLAEWDIELTRYPDAGLRASFESQRREFERGFCRFVADNYAGWIAGEEAPPLSVDVAKRWLVPHLQARTSVVFVVIDCMRLDQWLSVEPVVAEFFHVERDYHYAVLPTATPFARNALFAGLLPSEFAQVHSDLWDLATEDDTSMNRYERQLMDRQLKKLGFSFDADTEPKYAKVLDQSEGNRIAREMRKIGGTALYSIVYNFLDLLAHGRNESELLQAITPDEAAFRGLMHSWFVHSPLWTALQSLAKQDCVVVITSDHGSVLGSRGTPVRARRDSSPSLRYKVGNNLGCDVEHAIVTNEPKRYGLPSFGIGTTYCIALEDYYFVYRSRFHEYQRQFRNTFMHGGVSLQEMIVPVVTLKPKR
jgi:CheY-like chemotaxis protein